MKYALLLNDMRWPNIENIAVVRTADNMPELVGWYQAQLADKPYSDPGEPHSWGKAFKKGSELEWYNPVHDINRMNDYWGGIWEVPDDTQVGTGLTKAGGIM